MDTLDEQTLEAGCLQLLQLLLGPQVHCGIGGTGGEASLTVGTGNGGERRCPLRRPWWAPTAWTPTPRR